MTLFGEVYENVIRTVSYGHRKLIDRHPNS